MDKKKYLIIVGGPTASGKTAMAIGLAQHFQTEIISADSRQFYQEMSIGTAKPTAEELAAAPHHFINSLSVHDEYSVGDFERDALSLLEVLFQKHEVVVVAGGSGLFIRALCEGLDEFPDVPAHFRKEVEELFENQGITALQSELKLADPAYFGTMDTQNPHRLIRALSFCRATGQPFSSFRKQEKKERPFQPIYLLLDLDREILYQKINKRVDEMMANGLLEEARNLWPLRHLNALQTVGYQELFDFFEEKTTLERAVELIKQNSRRYAKRQMTWFRKDDFWKAIKPGDVDEAIRIVENCLAKK